jgi:hypothetical protein
MLKALVDTPASDPACLVGRGQVAGHHISKVSPKHFIPASLSTSAYNMCGMDR